ncbi:Fumarylacetoacetate hydrolase protein [Rutstroemia sp. NJR-2017a BVV2]|nr:Fumarylacetoacetate hydrolase protein [Rutstroemia sp. NJR-2017a BVV2]
MAVPLYIYTMSTSDGPHNRLTNYIAYLDTQDPPTPRIGHLDLETSTIQPLSFLSGAPLTNLYQVIPLHPSQIIPTGSPIPLSLTTLLPPLPSRDVLAIGKNYPEHAAEFHSSGYDSSDQVAQPTHPVIFTKRATSIIASGEAILPHAEFTQTLDYEGEIGVIIGKPGFRIKEEDAMDYVWGYTIINDVTARERQRDHKQFFLGKSADSFCPMGPIAVPASALPQTLRVQTHVNGSLRQDSTTANLIFSIPYLIATLSLAQTLQPGDVIATGTPFGVGFGQSPPTFLQPGDTVEISVTGLGTLTNTVAATSARNKTLDTISSSSHQVFPVSNLDKSAGGKGLTTINSKPLYYRKIGSTSTNAQSILFIHGLGDSSECWTPLIEEMELDKKYVLHLLDLEGHGLSPTSAVSVVSIESYARDVAALVEMLGIRDCIIIAHGMGCLVAVTALVEVDAKANASEVVMEERKTVLLGPPPLTTPLPDEMRKDLLTRAETARKGGMAAVVDSLTPPEKKRQDHLARTLERIALMGMDAEGYAKGCTALASWEGQLTKIKTDAYVVNGISSYAYPVDVTQAQEDVLGPEKGNWLAVGGFWRVFEDWALFRDLVDGVAGFLG